MKLPRRVVLVCLVSMTLLSAALRYPRTDHELGVDSFFIHNLSTSVVDNGYAEWILNPLSLFGWYPMSYPSGGPFLLSGLSQLGSLPVEASILVSAMAFGTFGILNAFVMAREFRKDDLFAIAVAFTYGFAPRFLAFNLWSASMRGLFMALLPLFFWSLMRAQRDPRPLNLAVMSAVFIVLAITHRLAVLLAVVMIASIASGSVVVILRILRARFPSEFLATPYRRLAPYMALSAFIGVCGATIFGTQILDEYSVGELASGQSIGVKLTNLGVSLARSVGLALLFAVAGILVLVRTKAKTLKEPFVLLAFVGLTPTLFLRQYTGFYILPLIALSGALPLVPIARLHRNGIRHLGIAAFFAATLVFSISVLQYEMEHSTGLTSDTYSTATYLRFFSRADTIIANDGLTGIRIASIAGCPYLPVGGAGTTFQSPELLAYRFFTRQEVEAGMIRIPLQDLTLESDSLWVVPEIQAEADWVRIMQAPFTDNGNAFLRYRPQLYVESAEFAAQFFAYGNRYPSVYAVSAHDGAYKLYDSGVQSVWFVAVSRGS